MNNGFLLLGQLSACILSACSSTFSTYQIVRLSVILHQRWLNSNHKNLFSVVSYSHRADVMMMI